MYRSDHGYQHEGCSYYADSNFNWYFDSPPRFSSVALAFRPLIPSMYDKHCCHLVCFSSVSEASRVCLPGPNCYAV